MNQKQTDTLNYPTLNRLKEIEFNNLRFSVKYMINYYVSSLTEDKIVKMPIAKKAILLDAYRFINSNEINELFYINTNDLQKLQHYKSIAINLYDCMNQK